MTSGKSEKLDRLRLLRDFVDPILRCCFRHQSRDHLIGFVLCLVHGLTSSFEYLYLLNFNYSEFLLFPGGYANFFELLPDTDACFRQAHLSFYGGLTLELANFSKPDFS